VPETGIKNITEWNVEVKKYTFNTRVGKPVDVYYTFPKTDKGNATILFALPGTDPHSEPFMEYFKYLSETENIIVISPEFSSENFSGTSQYNELNIARNINNPENWLSKIIDDIFLDFKGRFSLPNDKYILYGFSAGGQFTHRATMFSESPYMEYSISAAPGGWMTFPTDQANYPYGIKNLPMYKDLMNRNFARRMYILSGNRDNANTAGQRPNADFQGSRRHEREVNFYQTSKDYCKQNGLTFNIDILVMDGVGHNDTRSRPYVIDIIKGIYDSIKKNIGREIEGGGYGMAVTNITSDKTTISQGDATPFNAGAAFRNISAETYTGGDWGIALVDNNGFIMAVLGFRSLGSRDPGANINLGYVSCIVPSAVKSGTYKLQMVIRTTGNDWRIATDSYNGSPTSINFTVQ
jgi:hypothetical protein